MLDPNNLTRIEMHSMEFVLCWDMDKDKHELLDPDSSVSRICMDVLNVEFIRPWLCRELLEAEWGYPALSGDIFLPEI